MQVIMNGKQLELTEAIEQYTEKKISALEKYFEGIIKATATLWMETHHHNKGEIFFAECKLEVPGGDLFAKTTGADIYSSIDVLQDELKAEIKKYKQKIRGNDKKKKVVGRSIKEYQIEVEEEV